MAKRTKGNCEQCGEYIFLTQRKDGTRICKLCIEHNRRSRLKEELQPEDLIVPIFPGVYVNEEQKQMVKYYMELMGWTYLEDKNIYVKKGFKTFDEETGRLVFPFLKGKKRKVNLKLPKHSSIIQFYEKLLYIKEARAKNVPFKEIQETTGWSQNQVQRYFRYSPERMQMIKNFYLDEINLNKIKKDNDE